MFYLSEQNEGTEFAPLSGNTYVTQETFYLYLKGEEQSRYLFIDVPFWCGRTSYSSQPWLSFHGVSEQRSGYVRISVAYNGGSQAITRSGYIRLYYPASHEDPNKLIIIRVTQHPESEVDVITEPEVHITSELEEETGILFYLSEQNEGTEFAPLSGNTDVTQETFYLYMTGEAQNRYLFIDVPSWCGRTSYSSQPWLSFHGVSEQRSGYVRISVAYNGGSQAITRGGYIRLFSPASHAGPNKFTVIRVTQHPSRLIGPVLSLSRTGWNPPMMESTKDITVISNSNLVWRIEVTEGRDWLSVENVTPNNQTGMGSFRIRVRNNGGPGCRVGFIQVSSGGIRTGIRVTQASINNNPPSSQPVLRVSPETSLMGARAGHFRVDVESNRQWNVRHYRNNDASSWMRIRDITYHDCISGGDSSVPRGFGSFELFVEPNHTGRERSGTVEVVAITGAGHEPLRRTITVTQAATYLLTGNVSRWNPTAIGGHIDVRITSNASWNATSSDPRWLWVEPSSHPGGYLRIRATAYTGTTQRIGTVTIRANELEETIIVTQAGAVTQSLTVSPSSWRPSALGGSLTAEVGTNSNSPWTIVSSAPSWLTFDSFSPTDRVGNGRFVIRATPNTGTTQRTGTITVAVPGALERVITVTQAGAATLTVSQSSWNPLPAGGSLNIGVGTNSNSPWTVVSSSTSWLTVGTFNPPNRIGNGSFSISATPNNGTMQRTGTVTVAVPGAMERVITVTQPAPTLSIRTQRWTPTALGGQVGIGINSNTTWTVTSNAPSWLTVDPLTMTDRTGNGNITIRATQNTGITQRIGTITVTANGLRETITVTQAAAATLTLSHSGWRPSALGGNLTVEVGTNSNAPWTIVSSAPSWLTFDSFSPTNRVGNGRFVIRATPNTGTTQRIGSITVAVPGALERTITVIQAPAATLTVSHNSWRPLPIGGSLNIGVGTNSNVPWTVRSSASWLTVGTFNPPNRTGNGTFFISATQNTGTAQRTGTITVAVPGALERVITVTQPAPTLTIGTGTWNPSEGGGSIGVGVNSNTTWTVTSNAPGWLTVDSISPVNRTGNGRITIRATRNAGTTQRIGTITVTTPGVTPRTIRVTQAGAPTLTIPANLTTWNVQAGGGSVRVNVTSNRTWTVSSNATSWLTVSPSGGGGNSPFTIRATANTTASTRRGTVTVTTPGVTPRTITVNQPPAPAHLRVPVTTWNVQDGRSWYWQISVTTNRPWTVSSNATSWLTVSPSGGGGNGSFTIRVATNNTTGIRRGTITVSAGGLVHRIAVSQPPIPPHLRVPVTTWNVQDGRSWYWQISVTTNRPWTVSSNATSWLTVSPSGGGGNGSFTIRVAPNNTTGIRRGTITVSAGGLVHRIAVSQPPAPPPPPPHLIVSVNTWNAPSGGGNIRVDIATNRTWTVSSNATSWLTVSPSGGGGNSPFFIRAAPNNTNSARRGTITVSAGGIVRHIAVIQPRR